MQVVLELAHGEELEDAVLDLVEVVVVAVEDLAGMLHVEVVLAARAPGQGDDPVEVGADDRVLGALRRDLGEPVELAPGRLVDLLRERELLDLAAQFVDLRLLLVGLAQLLLDGLELLAQEVLALALVDLAAHVALDLRAQLQHVELAGQDADELAHALLDVVLLEQVLLVLGLDAHGAGDEEGERPRLLHVGGRHLELLRQVGDERHDLAEHAEQAGAQGVDLTRLPGLVLDLLDARHQVGLFAHELRHAHALQALHQDAHRAVGQLDHLVRQPHRTDRVQQVRSGRLHLRILARDHGQQAVAGEHVVDELDAALLADGQRDHRVREHHRVAQRQHRQDLGDLLGLVLLRGRPGLLRIAHCSPPPVVMSILRAPFSCGVRMSRTSRMPAS